MLVDNKILNGFFNLNGMKTKKKYLTSSFSSRVQEHLEAIHVTQSRASIHAQLRLQNDATRNNTDSVSTSIL